MNSFQEIVKYVLEEEGWWVSGDVKVNISKEAKKALENPSMPRPEIDLVAYKPSENLLVLFEVKSYLDSYGTKLADLEDLNEKRDGRYKLLTWKALRDAVEHQLLKEWKEAGRILADATVVYGFAGGKFKDFTEEELRKQFGSKGYSDWRVLGPESLKEKLQRIVKKGYEDNVIVMLTKVLEK